MQRECNQRGTETVVWLLVTRNKLGNLGRQTGTENRNRVKLNIHVTPVELQINLQSTNILFSLSINMRS